MHRALPALAASIAFELSLASLASAQPEAPDAEVRAPESERERKPASPSDPGEELVERLLTSEPEDPDLEWLYSNEDEYSPSRLTGKPIPAPALPERGQGSRRAWDPRYRKFGAANYVLTGAGFLGALSSAFIAEEPARWRNRNDFDEWGRRRIGIGDYEAGLWARDLSDVLVSVGMAYPLLVDSLIVTHWYRRSPELAGQMALITVETMAVSMGIQGITSALASRERPYGRDCGSKLPADLDDCVERVRYRSYFSGHSSNAFTAATLACGHHVRHDLFGSAAADATTCGVVYASATTVALMRVVGQRHYLSDVLSGAAVGTLVGWGVPWLFHYGPLARSDGDGTSTTASYALLPLPNGVALGGTF